MAGWVTDPGHPCLSDGASRLATMQSEVLGGQLRTARSFEGSKIFAVGTLVVDRAQSPVLIMAVKPTRGKSVINGIRIAVGEFALQLMARRGHWQPRTAWRRPGAGREGWQQGRDGGPGSPFGGRAGPGAHLGRGRPR